MICQVLHVVLLTLISSIFAQHLSQNEESCPDYINSFENVATLTYNDFRNSSNRKVRIYDEIEQPVSLSSFFITRNKQRIYQFDCKKQSKRFNSGDRFSSPINCNRGNEACERNPTSYIDCYQSDITKTPILLYLDISNGSLQNLHPNAFVTVSRCLKYLKLSNNAITKIPQKTFATLNNLQDLDISHNKLTQWDKFILENINLKKLDISFNQIQEVDESAIRDIKSVYISHNNLTHFNLKSDKETSLEYLNIANNKLESINLSNVTNLVSLDISHNRITSLSNCITNADKLENLIASYNNLSEFDDISQLMRIKTLNLDHNNLQFINLTNFNLKSDTETSLEYLNIANNKLESIYLSNVTNLISLDISHNRITSLSNCITNADKLYLLSASYNNISEFDDISQLMRIKTLHLDHNNLQFINLTKLTMLTYLDLSYNKLLLHSGTFGYLPKLSFLFLNYNEINYIPVNSFYSLSTLQTLSLANNNLHSFEFGSFSGLINLISLDLSYNKLNVFESDKLIDLNNLQALILDGNIFKTFNLSDLNIKLYNLQSIGLANMYWTCEDLVKIKIELRKMKMSLKYNSNSNEINYNIDGIDCIPKDYNSTNYLKRFIQSTTTTQPLLLHNAQIEKNEQEMANFASTNLSKDFTSVLIENNTSLNHLEDIEYNNISMPSLFLIFLQKIDTIVKKETNNIDNSIKKLENTSLLLLHKLERIEEHFDNHAKFETDENFNKITASPTGLYTPEDN